MQLQLEQSEFNELCAIQTKLWAQGFAASERWALGERLETIITAINARSKTEQPTPPEPYTGPVLVRVSRQGVAAATIGFNTPNEALGYMARWYKMGGLVYSMAADGPAGELLWESETGRDEPPTTL